VTNKPFAVNHFVNMFIDPAFNRCNLKCPHCATGQGVKINDNPPGFLTLSTLRDVCSKSLKEFKGKIRLFNWGEGLLNPEIGEIVKFLKENTKARIVVASNFSFNYDNRVKEVLNNLKNDMVILSCDGFSQATCEKYRIGVDFDMVMHNVKLIKDNKKPETWFAWQYLKFPWNIDEIKPAAEYCRKNNIPFYTSIGDLTEDYPMLPIPRTYSRRKFRCCLFLEGLAINFDGEVYPCTGCFGSKRFSIGNAREKSLEEIFINGRGKEMVDYLTYKSQGDDDLFCKHCIERNTAVLNTGYSAD